MPPALTFRHPSFQSGTAEGLDRLTVFRYLTAHCAQSRQSARLLSPAVRIGALSLADERVPPLWFRGDTLMGEGVGIRIRTRGHTSIPAF
jgi:hypothetical protein